jgi:hypothetical protein
MTLLYEQTGVKKSVACARRSGETGLGFVNDFGVALASMCLISFE